jgi:hypothetical protein
MKPGEQAPGTSQTEDLACEAGDSCGALKRQIKPCCRLLRGLNQTCGTILGLTPQKGFMLMSVVADWECETKRSRLRYMPMKV